MSKIVGWFKASTKNKIIALGGLVVILLVIAGAVFGDSPSADVSEDKNEDGSPKVEVSEFDKETEKLRTKCGEPPAGFRWGDGCTQIAVGKEGMSDEDVLFTYLRALSLLDLETAEKYSYKTDVIKQYSKLYDVEKDYSFLNEFKRAMYTETLGSMQLQGISKRTPFADKRRVIHMKVNMYDMQDRDFWLKDKDKIFDALSKYKVSESDTGKAKEYLFQYTKDYFASGKAKRKVIEIPITVEQTTDGTWLVVDDSTLNAICDSGDSETIVNYILERYSREMM